MSMPPSAGPVPVVATIHTDELALVHQIDMVQGVNGPTVLLKLKNDLKGKIHARIDVHRVTTMKFEGRNGCNMQIGKQTGGAWSFDNSTIAFQSSGQDGYLYLDAPSKIVKDTVIGAIQVESIVPKPWTLTSSDVMANTTIANVGMIVIDQPGGKITVPLTVPYSYQTNTEIMKLKITPGMYVQKDSFNGNELWKNVVAGDIDANGWYTVKWDQAPMTLTSAATMTFSSKQMATDSFEFDTVHPTDHSWMDIAP